MFTSEFGGLIVDVDVDVGVGVDTDSMYGIYIIHSSIHSFIFITGPSLKKLKITKYKYADAHVNSFIHIYIHLSQTET